MCFRVSNQFSLCENSTMEKIQNFESVISALKNYEIVRIESPKQTIFAYIENRIYAKTDHAKFSLTIEEFSDLYINSIFYLHEKPNNTEIEISKDDEYYAWKHK